MSDVRQSLFSLINDLQDVSNSFVILPEHQLVFSVNHINGAEMQFKATVAQLSAAIAAIPAPIGLDDLTDVTITIPSIGETLIYDGAQWINVTAASIELFQTLPYVAPIANVITFPLTVNANPLFFSVSKLFINGQKIAQGTGYSMTPTSVLYNDLYLGAPLDGLDTIEIYYY
jgi:hypothetical protein